MSAPPPRKDLSNLVAKADLNSLNALHALFVYKHVTKAAEELNVTQSALSQTLGKLRKHFEDKLLVPDRSAAAPYPLAFTPVASELAPRVAHVVEDALQVFAHRSTFDPTNDHRTFSILASDYVCDVLLRPIIRSLPALAPHVRFDIRPVLSGYDKQLRDGVVDVLILPTALDELEAFRSEALFTDQFVLAMDKNNPLAHQDHPVTLEQFHACPQVHYATTSTDLPSLPGQELARHGVADGATASLTSFLAVPHVLADSSLVSVMHSRLVDLFPTLTHRPLPFHTERIVEAMHWPPRHESDPSRSWLRSLLRDAATALPELSE